MSAIRALRQVSLASSRLAVRSAPRTLSVLAPRAAPLAARAFSVSARVWSQGASDVSLAERLKHELMFEEEDAYDAEPQFIKDFTSPEVWAIEDIKGNDEVALTRKFGNETIRVMFSIADIQAEEENEFNEEDESAAADEEDLPTHAYPIRVSLSITKTGAEGALTVDTMVQEGSFIVDSIAFYTNTKVGTELSAEMDWKRRGLYIGPQFDTLDVAVQEEFEKFLQEREINESLAVFITSYAAYKEQMEYLQWLENVKKFVEA